jgi:tRNA pseudouridine38-40 synthase
VSVFRLTIEYDGGAFHGWQAQPDTRTVQGVLEEALGTVVREPVALQGASRTDAGVHALGQVASFETDVDLAAERVARGVTALGGPDVAVVEAAIAPDGFNARHDSIGKRYRYRVLNRSSPSPIMAPTSWHVPRQIDLDRMRHAAESLVGTHDFAGFRAADCGRDNTERTMDRIEVRQPEAALIEIEVCGNAFLKNMVRIIAGTLVEVGRGSLPAGTIQAVLESRDRTRAGRTAPACGLTLVEVLYPDGWLRLRRL